MCMYIYGVSIRRGKARQGKARYARESGHGLCIYVSKYLSIQVYIYCRKAGGRESGVGSGSGEWGVFLILTDAS